MGAVAMAMRMRDNKKGEGSIEMAMLTRVAGELWQQQQRGQWQWQQGWRARMRAMTRAAQAVAMAMKRVIARKRAIASSNNNEMMATETTTMTKIRGCIDKSLKTIFLQKNNLKYGSCRYVHAE
jgi:hypothetical protein